MIEKHLKVHNRSDGSGTKPGREEMTSLFFRTPDMATLLANQRHAVDAVTAATEKLLEGATEISRRQLALHNSLMQMAFQNTLDYLKPNGQRADGKAEEAAETTAETTLNAMRDIASTALKCNVDALTAFSDRIRKLENVRVPDRDRTAHAAD